MSEISFLNWIPTRKHVHIYVSIISILRTILFIFLGPENLGISICEYGQTTSGIAIFPKVWINMPLMKGVSLPDG